MVLYKYFGEDRISILRDGLIRFSQPQAFNDPFELKPIITEVMDPESLKSQLAEQFPKILKENYDKLPRKNRRTVSFEKFMVDAELNRGELAKSIAASSRDAARFLGKNIHEKLEELFGVLSLTESHSNLLMWAHYANSHQGFVVGLDTSSSFFNRKKLRDDALRHLRKVSYSNMRPNIPLNQLGAPELFLTKSKEWEYEQEWRMVLPLKDSDQHIQAIPYDIHLFKLPFETIKSVIIGARAEQSTLEEIQSAVSTNPELLHVKINQMSIHPNRFELVRGE